MLTVDLEAYLLTAGALGSLIGFISMFWLSRKDIGAIFKHQKIRPIHIMLLVAILTLFIGMEFIVIKPTQQLFFDDAIYQAMAQQLLHTGKAVMCNYGTPFTCYSAQLFHEPIGTAVNMALSFAIAGVSRAVGYATELWIALIAIIATFFSSILLFKSMRAALFSTLILALTPVMLVWAWPTSSDMTFLAYSMVTFFSLLVFINRKNIHTFGMVLFSAAFVLYTKINAVAFVALIPLLYIILDGRSFKHSITSNLKLLKLHILDTKLLIALLVFVLLIAPEITYFVSNATTANNYGYAGVQIQRSCSANGVYTQATGNINLNNFMDNICANLSFWFNFYKQNYVMQPIAFTALALFGAIALMLASRQRELLAIILWFGVFFITYTAFYAGSVNYGVDWRFMLSLIAQVALLGGAAAAFIIEQSARMIARRSAAIKRISAIGVTAVIIVVLFYPIYSLLPYLSVKPSTIQQAGDARFYETFIYNSSSQIPNSCIVLTYDPTLLNLNNRVAAQMSYIYNSTQMQQFRNRYSCIVIDYGYWCYTPDNICTYVSQHYNLSAIESATYRNGNTYYLYKLGNQTS